MASNAQREARALSALPRIGPDEATALQLAAEGQAMLAGARPGGELQGMQLMLASRALKQTPEGDRALASSVVVQRNVHKMIEVGSPVRSVAVQPKGTVFASGEENGAVRLWDANTGEPVRDLLAGNGGNGGDEKAVNAVAFSPDKRWVGSASEDGSVRWWNAAPASRSARC